MTILQIFNKYKFAGGEEASVLRVAGTLEKHHKVVRCYFESSAWFDDSRPFAQVRQAFAMFYNPVAIRRVMSLIEKEKPDLIIIHNVFPICSFGMLWKIVRLPIPVVQYIHNFRPFSVNGYSWGKGRILTEGFHLNFLPEILAGSWQDSQLKTAWYAIIILCSHFTGCYKRISGWLAISEFMKEKFVSGGIDPEKITVLRHSWDSLSDDEYLTRRKQLDVNGTMPTPTFLFMGRISQEKGVLTLVDAWKAISRDNPSAQLIVCGSGPLDDWLHGQADEIPSLHFLGHVGGEKKQKLLAECLAVVVPSVWWEPLGIVVYEAYDNGKPVLAAASGGLTETVLDGITGLLHQPGDALCLAACMARLLNSPHDADEMGQRGREFLLRATSPKNWEQSINVAFNEAISRKFANYNENQIARDAQDLGALAVQPSSKIHISIYLADQNPGQGRSLGISRMSKVILDEMAKREDLGLKVLCTMSSQKGPEIGAQKIILPWSTRTRIMRLLTDQLHPVLAWFTASPDIWYFPKGFLPRFNLLKAPTVVTVHDTIIQHHADHYPHWRKKPEYAYWARMLRHTLRHADVVLTVSEHSRAMILAFMARHKLPEREITVTYEPCVYEAFDQPVDPPKGDHVLHLASREPHKRSHDLICWWAARARVDGSLPVLELVGNLPPESWDIVASNSCFRHRPFLDDEELRNTITQARALILPSEIEGFGLPAIEAYYLGTPVCFTKGTSIEEILGQSTSTGGIELDAPESLWPALEEVLAMSAGEIRRIGLELRVRFKAEKIVGRMVEAFRKAAGLD